MLFEGNQHHACSSMFVPELTRIFGLWIPTILSLLDTGPLCSAGLNSQLHSHRVVLVFRQKLQFLHQRNPSGTVRNAYLLLKFYGLYGNYR